MHALIYKRTHSNNHMQVCARGICSGVSAAHIEHLKAHVKADLLQSLKRNETTRLDTDLKQKKKKKDISDAVKARRAETDSLEETVNSRHEMFSNV